MRAANLLEIQEIALRALRDKGVIRVFAGTALAQPAPNGLRNILAKSNSRSLGATGGLTLIKSSAAFTIPSLSTRATAVRQGSQVSHYAEVQSTVSSDATHESFYPGPGDHLRPIMPQRIGNRIYSHYWRISRQVSELIRQGEEEHLADARRAYDLTYKLIGDTINGLVGRRFGPARTPFGAEQMVEAELARRLPRQLGTDPGNWVAVLDRLLLLTQERDRNGWHSISTDPPRTEGGRIIHPVSTTNTTSVGRIPSSQVVNY